ncbi:MAG TPA: T9SS type A sorting domain-containing protein, partial [Bacteroidota bacterium]
RASGPQSLGTALGGRIAGAVDINGHLVGGDILLIVDYTNGGSKPVISVREWSTNSGGSWFLIADSLTTGKAFVVTNTSNVAAVAPGQGVSPNGSFTDTTVALQFVEFGLDLTGLNLLPIDPCNPLATALFQTRSSASFTSSLMDFALGRFAVIPPPLADAGPDQASCPQGDVSTFTLAGSAANGTPLWSVLSGRVAITDPTSLTSTITDTGTGTAVLLLTVTSNQNCGAATDTVVFTINPNPTVSVNNTDVCGGVSGTLTATPSGGTGAKTFAWSTGATTSTISSSTAGTYSVTVTDSKGCTGSGSGTLSLNPNPTVSVNSPTVCASALPATLTATPAGGTGAATFSWSTGATTSTISTSTAGTYSVTVTDTKGCTGSGTGTLTVNPNLTVSVNNPAVCGGLAATLTASASSGTPAYTYSWSTGATTSTISTTTAGTFSVTVTDSKSCTGSGSGTATVNPNPTVSVPNVEVCASAAPATLTATPSGGTGASTFAWSTGATTSTISTSTAGTYSVTVTDTKGCTGSTSGTLTIDPNPTVTVANDSVCPGSSATLTANASGGTGAKTYAWSTGATTSTISTSTAGTYSVTVTDTKGCTGSGSASVITRTPPSPSATGGSITCFDPCTTISASPAGLTYSWTGPGGFTSSAQSPTVCDSGDYSVTVTDTHGCTGTASAHVSNVIPPSGTCGADGAITLGFELDGDPNAVAPNPPDDWNLIFNGSAHPTSTTGIVSDFPSKADDYFVIGTKDIVDVTQWHYNVQSTPDKDDILNAGAAEYGTRLYFFGDRYSVNGNAQIGFWFFQDTVHLNTSSNTFTGQHEIGDLLVLSNFIQGGGTPVIFAYEWVGSGGSDGSLNKLTLNASNSFAITNSTVSTPPWLYNPKGKSPSSYPKGAFFEGGIDVACLPGVNPCFASFLIETRASASVTAELKDFVIGSFTVGVGAQAQAALAPRLNGGEQAQSVAKPAGYALHANYPNPFNPTTQIKFDLPEASHVRLSVFNILGQEVASLVNGTMGAGFQSVEWNTSNREGAALPSGVYFYRLQATSLTSGTEFHGEMKMVLMK